MQKEDSIGNIIGNFGKYQTWITVLILVAHLPSDFQMNNVLFLLPDVNYVCKDDDAFNQTNHCPCKTSEYDRKTIIESVTSEWNLICDRKYLASLAQSVMQAGMLLGSLVFGFILDRYGRKKVVVLALLLQPFFQTMSMLVSDYWLYAACRFFTGFAAGGTFLCCYVYLIELSGKAFRPFLLGIHELPYVVGYIFLPIIAYFVRRWRTFQLVIAAPWLVVIVLYWLLPESPRWLITVGRKKEAIEILTHIAKKNNRSIENIERIIEDIEKQLLWENKQEYGTYLDLIKTSKIRAYTIIISLIWMCCAHAYFGMNQYIGRLQGDVYLNVLLAALCHIPGMALVVLSAIYLRRKTNIIITFTISACSLLSFIFIPKATQPAIVTFAIIGQIGMYTSFTLIYLYTTEVFPTVVRNSAMGFASSLGRIGGFLAPFVVNIGIEWISIIIFSVTAFCATFLCCLLPETKDIVLSDTIKQGEQLKTET